MKDKINTLFDCIKNLCNSDLERIINFVMNAERPTYTQPVH